MDSPRATGGFVSPVDFPSQGVALAGTSACQDSKRSQSQGLVPELHPTDCSTEMFERPSLADAGGPDMQRPARRLAHGVVRRRQRLTSPLSNLRKHRSFLTREPLVFA